MAPEAGAAGLGGRPRPALLIALAATVGLLVVWWVWSGGAAAPAPAATPTTPRSRAAALAARKAAVTPADTEDLNVRLDALKAPRPAAGGTGRNPFRFYTPPPPPPPQAARPAGPPVQEQPEAPVVPAGPPQPPPITLKYIGLMEGVPGQGKVAAFSDCRSTMQGREGEIVAGQYRLVRIGVESVVLEYVDGRGRTTIRMSGQDCVGK